MLTDPYLIQYDLAAIGSEMLQAGERLAEDFEQGALHGQHGLLLYFVPLASTRRPGSGWLQLLGRRLWGALRPGEGAGRQ